MPLYDFDCDACGYALVDHRCRADDRDLVRCPKCEASMTLHFVPARMMLTGAQPSKPIHVAGANVSFESNSGYREYLKANPDVRVVDSSDSSWKGLKDRSTDQANKMAKRHSCLVALGVAWKTIPRRAPCFQRHDSKDMYQT